MTHNFTVTGTEAEISFLFQTGAIRSAEHLGNNSYNVTLRNDGEIPCMSTAQKVYEWSLKEDRIDPKHRISWNPCFEAGDMVEIWLKDDKHIMQFFNYKSEYQEEIELLSEYLGVSLRVEEVKPYTMKQVGGVYCSHHGEIIELDGKPYLFDDYILCKV